MGLPNIKFAGFAMGEVQLAYTGMSASVNATCKFLKLGGMVVLFIPSQTGTSNANTFTATGLPKYLRVKAIQRYFAPIYDNGTVNMKAMDLETDGSITFHNGTDGAPAATSFTTSGTKGTLNHTLVYLIDSAY